MNRKLYFVILSLIIFTSNHSLLSAQTPTQIPNNIKSELEFTNNEPDIPYQFLIKKENLSPKALIAYNYILNSIDRNPRTWIFVYRENDENYIFLSRNKKVLIFETNPEKGGDRFSIPSRKIFLVNPAHLKFMLKNQDPKTGAYKLAQGSYERWITPLMYINKDGIVDSQQFKEEWWALHSPPYKNKNYPSDQLNEKGSSCLRLKISVAKYIQQIATIEVLENKKTVFLTRWKEEVFIKK
jgi:hypothetical protein